MDLGFVCCGMSSTTPPGWCDGGVGVYLHGEAESEAGFDIPSSSIDLSSLPDGEHPASLNGKRGYTLVLWRHPHMLRGLICRNDDTPALEHARARCAARSTGL